MLDTITYIPTILAYTFISLLVVILCFIVIYVSHKVYISVYDNLPVVHSSAFRQVEVTRYTTGNAGLREFSSTGSRKTRTALRIIVTLEPCYLAFVVFETEATQDQPRSPMLPPTAASLQQLTAGTSPSTVELTQQNNQRKLVKYYDRLSAIPMVDTCPETEAPRPSMLNSVINAMAQNVISPRRASMVRSVQRPVHQNVPRYSESRTPMHSARPRGRLSAPPKRLSGPPARR